MLGLKRLDTFMLQRFLPLLLMTFFICLFIVLMQFLFRMIDDLVGKGLGFDVLGELFFYAALTMVPTALPLAVLLASLMVFGNLGEKLELTAMKAAGISLFRIMAPLMVLMALIAVGAFFFQNNVLPVAQSRMWTLMFSVRQKTPEVEIPERSFYDEIPGMNLYIDHKDPETGMLYGMIIYDLTKGTDNPRVILADSGRFSFTEDKTRLYLEMHSGEMFENLTDRSMGASGGSYLPFRREEFTHKDVYFKFDANFNRMDEGGIRSQYVGQNIAQLRTSIDSLTAEVDSIGASYADELLTEKYGGVQTYRMEGRDGRGYRRVAVPQSRTDFVTGAKTIDLDSVFAKPSPSYTKTYITQAISDAKRVKSTFEYRADMLKDQSRLMRRHKIELQRKFTLSFAILVFFFIGAPLGAIIKKGGLGTPLVISVLLFIVYYIFDNTGFKMARDGKLEVWEGMWLSTVVLLPLGIFFTRKAVDDSAVFNADAYRNFFLRLIGRQPKRSLEMKELIMTEVEAAHAHDLLERLLTIAQGRGHRRELRDAINEAVDYLSNSRDPMVIALLNEYPFEPTRRNRKGIAENTLKLISRVQADSVAPADDDNIQDT